MDFSWAVDRVHAVRVSHPAGWTVVHADNESAAIILQATCDATTEETYKRLSVSWDDISWSATSAEDFGRGLAANMGTLLPGSELVAAGALTPALAGAGAGSTTAPFALTYRVLDAADRSQVELVNVFATSELGGRRRAYTATFGCDARAALDLRALAEHVLASFAVDGNPPAALNGQLQLLQRLRRGYSTDGRGGSGSGSERTGSVGGPTTWQLDAEDVSLVASHVNVWERPQHEAAAAAAASSSLANAGTGGVGGAAASAAGAPFRGETPADASRVAWAAAALDAACLSYRHPAAWLPSGAAAEELRVSGGGSVLRRWTSAHTCDRRETSFKQLSLVCVELTPLLVLVTARAAGDPAALEAAGGAGKLLLAFLVYSFRAELAAAAESEGAQPPPLPPADAALAPWFSALASQWPPALRLSHPLSPSAARETSAPQHTAIVDQRALGASAVLIKATGWLRSAGAGVGGLTPLMSGSASAPASGALGTPDRYRRASGSMLEAVSTSAARTGSFYSNVSSLDTDSAPAEGLLLQTTSAVLVGLHEVHRGGARRVFGHVFTCAFSTSVYALFESALAKAALQSLQPIA